MSILTGLLVQQMASRQGLDDTSKFLLLGWTLGSTPVGLGLTLALVKREVDELPPPPHASTGIIAKPPDGTG